MSVWLGKTVIKSSHYICVKGYFVVWSIRRAMNCLIAVLRKTEKAKATYNLQKLTVVTVDQGSGQSARLRWTNPVVHAAESSEEIHSAREPGLESSTELL